MYPKDVVEYVKSVPALAERFAPALPPTADNPNAMAGSAVDPGDFEFERWLVHDGRRESAAVRRYVFFMARMIETFDSIFEFFDKRNPTTAASGQDAISVQTRADEMLFLANHLYYLHSHGVEGDLLECGAFKGYSSCCLSWVCSYLGRKLLVADSFEGLPEDPRQERYSPGEFKGSIEEVTENLTTLGVIGSAELIKGFFSESLVGFDRPLMALWVDVDLYNSTMDVLHNAWSSLDPRGAFLCNEFGPQHVGPDHQIVPEPNLVPGAVSDFFGEKGISHTARHLTGWTALIVPNAEPGTVPVTSVLRFYELIRLLRVLQSVTAANARGSRASHRFLPPVVGDAMWYLKTRMDAGRLIPPAFRR